MARKPTDESPLTQRRDYLIKEVNQFIEMTGTVQTKRRVKIEAVPRLWDRDTRAVYTTRIRGELLPAHWTEELRDIVGRARSLLDNAMWTAAGGDRPKAYSSKEKDAIKFPIAHAEHEWVAFEKRKHAQALPNGVLAQLRAIQPFVTSQPVIRWLNKTNNLDKHRYPLKLAIVPDTLFVMLLDAGIAGTPGRDHNGFQWEPIAPVEHGKKLLEYRHPRALGPLRSADVPTALCVEIDGTWVDVQEFLWDTIEFVARASAILLGGDTGWADVQRAFFGAAREQVRNFQRTLVDEDPIAQIAWASGMESLSGTHDAVDDDTQGA